MWGVGRASSAEGPAIKVTEPPSTVRPSLLAGSATSAYRRGTMYTKGCSAPSRLGRKRLRAAAVAALVSGLAASCGGSTSTKSLATTVAPASTVQTTPSTLSTTMTTATALPSVAQDAAAANRVLLRLGDLPGYKALSSEVSPFVKVYSTCTANQLMPGGASGRRAGQGTFYLDETATVRALQTTGVSSFAVFADNEADARRAVADIAKPDVVQCVGKALLANVRDLTSPPVTGLSQTSVALPALRVGPESAGLRTTVTSAAPQYFDLTVVRKGRMLAYLFVVRLGKAPPPEADRQRLTDILLGRMP